MKSNITIGYCEKVNRLTLWRSFANRIEALWNLQSGFFESAAIALFNVARAASDFFKAC